jgi:nitrate reductase gamma subunit
MHISYFDLAYIGIVALFVLALLVFREHLRWSRGVRESSDKLKAVNYEDRALWTEFVARSFPKHIGGIWRVYYLILFTLLAILFVVGSTLFHWFLLGAVMGLSSMLFVTTAMVENQRARELNLVPEPLRQDFGEYIARWVSGRAGA